MKVSEALAQSEQRLAAVDLPQGLVTIYCEAGVPSSGEGFHLRFTPRSTDGSLNLAGMVIVGSYNVLEEAASVAAASYGVRDGDWMPASENIFSLHCATSHGPIIEGHRFRSSHDDMPEKTAERADYDHPQREIEIIKRWLEGAPELGAQPKFEFTVIAEPDAIRELAELAAVGEPTLALAFSVDGSMEADEQLAGAYEAGIAVALLAARLPSLGMAATRVIEWDRAALRRFLNLKDDVNVFAIIEVKRTPDCR